MSRKSNSENRTFSKAGRSYSKSVKQKIVSEVQNGLLSSRGAAKKYGINRKTIDSWITELSTLNLTPLKIAHQTITENAKGSDTKVLAKQVLDLTKELQQAKLKIVVWRQ